MEIAILHRHVDISDALRACVEEKVVHLARLLEMERAEVRFTEERNPRIPEKDVCEMTMVGHGHIVRARGTGTDAFVALDRVAEKLEHRLGKLKGRLVGRSHPRRVGPVDSVDRTGPEDEGDAEAGEGPRIVKTKQFAIKPMTPEEAAMQMELLGHDFFLFTNAETSRAAVVYRRGDAHVGLIDAS